MKPGQSYTIKRTDRRTLADVARSWLRAGKLPRIVDEQEWTELQRFYRGRLAELAGTTEALPTRSTPR